jgi:hypothetical protein
MIPEIERRLDHSLGTISGDAFAKSVVCILGVTIRRSHSKIRGTYVCHKTSLELAGQWSRSYGRACSLLRRLGEEVWTPLQGVVDE